MLIVSGERLARPMHASKMGERKFKQLTEFERGRIIGLREDGFFYRTIAAGVQWNSSTVIHLKSADGSSVEAVNR